MLNILAYSLSCVLNNPIINNYKFYSNFVNIKIAIVAQLVEQRSRKA